MTDLRGTYVHRGDRERRTKRVRAGVLLTAFAASVGLLLQEEGPSTARAADVKPLAATLGAEEATRLRAELASAEAELEAATRRLERWHRIFDFANKYRVKADLAASIYDAAVAEKIEPDLAFRVIRLESEFKERALSPVGAIGLAQVMLPTARYYQKDITREELYDRDTNLRIGFRYLRGLIREYKSVGTALLVYNRGPAAVLAAREEGIDPSNGYDRIVLKGYRGRGVID